MPCAWFLSPIKVRSDGARYCGMNDLTPEIFHAGGYWEEARTPDGRAVVRLRAPCPVLRSVKKLYTELTDAEAGKFHPPRVLTVLRHRVPGVAPSKEVTAILGRWAGIGFGQGWRLPRRWQVWLAERGIEPGKWWLETLMRVAVDQRGAFPTQGVLDSFPQGDEDPVSSSGKWTSNVNSTYFGNSAGCQVVSNQLTGQSATYGHSYWSDSTFGPDSEAYGTFNEFDSLDGTLVALFARITSPGASMNGYMARTRHVSAGNDEAEIHESNGGTMTIIGATVDIGGEYGAGDKLGIGVTGSATTTIRMHRNTGGGWAEMFSRTDSVSPHTAAGNIGVAIDNNVSDVDDFGGGTVTIAGVSNVTRVQIIHDFA